MRRMCASVACPNCRDAAVNKDADDRVFVLPSNRESRQAEQRLQAEYAAGKGGAGVDADTSPLARPFASRIPPEFEPSPSKRSRLLRRGPNLPDNSPMNVTWVSSKQQRTSRGRLGVHGKERVLYYDGSCCGCGGEKFALSSISPPSPPPPPSPCSPSRKGSSHSWYLASTTRHGRKRCRIYRCSVPQTLQRPVAMLQQLHPCQAKTCQGSVRCSSVVETLHLRCTGSR